MDSRTANMIQDASVVMLCDERATPEIAAATLQQIRTAFHRGSVFVSVPRVSIHHQQITALDLAASHDPPVDATALVDEIGWIIAGDHGRLTGDHEIPRVQDLANAARFTPGGVIIGIWWEWLHVWESGRLSRHLVRLVDALRFDGAAANAVGVSDPDGMMLAAWRERLHRLRMQNAGRVPFGSIAPVESLRGIPQAIRTGLELLEWQKSQAERSEPTADW